jgi:hypothetical protein
MVLMLIVTCCCTHNIFLKLNKETFSSNMFYFLFVSSSAYAHIFVPNEAYCLLFINYFHCYFISELLYEWLCP